MRRVRYNIEIKNNNAEQILNEIDQFFIELEHKHPELEVSI